jgi:FkbH-like protein
MDRPNFDLNSLPSRLAALGENFDRAALEKIEGELKPAAGRLAEIWPAVESSANALWLRARLESAAGNFADSEKAWQSFFQRSVSPDPLDLAACARACLETGHPEEAVRCLRRAMACPLEYSFFARVEKLIGRIPSEACSELRQTRVAILGTSTTAVLTPVLKALCLRDRVRAEVYQGLYGALDQEVLDAHSGLAAFQPQIAVLMMHWRDLHLDGMTSDPQSALRETVERLKRLWSMLSERFSCHVVQHAFDYPAEDSYGYLSFALPGGRGRLIEALNAELRAQLPPYVSLLDTPAAQREVGAHLWEHPVQWINFKQHPSTAALPCLAEAQIAHIRAALGLTRKVLVTDLDNTLWGGVIGEDGLDGIEIGPGTPAGEAHQGLQRYLLELKSRGVLLAVCSKNNPEDARLPFERHPYMALKLDDFAAFEANWQDKASTLRAIAAKLSLGLDSFVFLDDNAMEREWVRSRLPEVAVVELTGHAANYVRDLDRGRYFFSLTLSGEDVGRTELYRVEAKRENLRSAAGSIEDFLAELQIQASVEPITPKNLTRVTQLINKTNQFNVTTRRCTEAQVSRIAADSGGWAGAFHLADRFGSYGLIGVLFCMPSGSGCWEIDTWLMSCRVLGRQSEQFMFDRMMKEAAARGIREIVGVYRPTAKNPLVADHYEKFGFRKIGSTAEEVRYSIAVPKTPAVTATHIRDVSVGPASVVSAAVNAIVND